MTLDPVAASAGADQQGPDVALLRAALMGSRTSVVLVDLQLCCVWAVNLPAPLHASALAGATVAELFGPTGLSLVQRASAAIATEDELHGELELPLDAATRPFELRAQPVRVGGNLNGVLLTLTRLVLQASPGQGQTDAKRESERATDEQLASLNADLQRSRDLLRTIFDGLDDGLLLISYGGTILAANQRFAALCNSKPEALVGFNWRERCPALLPNFPVALVEHSLADGVARRVRLRVEEHQGRLRILDLQTLHPAESGVVPDQLVVQLRDVTEQLRMEAQTVAAERMAANERLAATVAHEVNTPLQAIESSLHLASRLGDAEQRARYLRLAREEIQRIGFILRQLLEQHRPPGDPGPLDVNELVERVLLLTGSSLRRQGVYVVRDLSAGLPALNGRSYEITQVLLNLVFNAMQAMVRGGRLTLRTALEQQPGGVERVLITVRDNGLGVDPAIVEQIFEPFYTTRPEGSGLGLAICRQLVEGHGGEIWLENLPGEGAAFHVALPLA